MKFLFSTQHKVLHLLQKNMDSFRKCFHPSHQLLCSKNKKHIHLLWSFRHCLLLCLNQKQLFDLVPSQFHHLHHILMYMNLHSKLHKGLNCRQQYILKFYAQANTPCLFRQLLCSKKKVYNQFLKTRFLGLKQQFFLPLHACFEFDLVHHS